MAAVADLERLLERIFERTSARVFRARPQAVQIERRIERAMEAARDRRGPATVVPSRYRVRFHPADLDDLAARSDGAAGLAGRLADAALVFARRHGYHVVERPMVLLVADASLERGRVEVDPLGVAGTARAAAVIDAPDAPLGPPPPSMARAVKAGAPTVSVPAAGGPEPMPVAQVPDSGAAWVAPATPGDTASPLVVHGIRADTRDPAVFRPPVPSRAGAMLRLTNGEAERTIEVGGAPVTIGRAPDNTLVLRDARVSRHHGRLQARRGTLVFTDLDSTNGSRVNGIRADEIVLGLGDRLQLGDAVLVVESLPG
jgi:Protein of unknown function (DUF3662)/Inner membrane component of T3SS, cytoplasmic domain